MSSPGNPRRTAAVVLGALLVCALLLGPSTYGGGPDGGGAGASHSPSVVTAVEPSTVAPPVSAPSPVAAAVVTSAASAAAGSNAEAPSASLPPPLPVQLAAVEASLPLLKVQNFHFQRTVPRGAEARPHHAPYAPPRTSTPLLTSCPSSIRPDHFCVPNLGRDWDAARGDRVFPISYTLPLDEYAAEAPSAAAKTQDCSIIVPRDKATYKFTSHAAYVAEYAASFYCLTFKKGGWDTLRHYEVIAAGCMPYMLDLEYIPEATMAHYPKALVLEARTLPGVHFDCRRVTVAIDHAVFPKARYFALLAKVMAHAREHMTTVASARYAMAAIGLPLAEDGTVVATDAVAQGGAAKKLKAVVGRKPRVLIVTKVQKGAPLRAQGNYNSWSLFHGLRTVLGAGAVDSHEQSFLYEQPLAVMQKQRPLLYGRGFGYAYKLKRLPDEHVNRTGLAEQLRQGRFDAVFFTDPFSASIPRRKNTFWLYDDAVAALPKHRVAFVHAPDIPYPSPGTVGYDVTRLYRKGTVFQREIPDCRYYAPPLVGGDAPEAQSMKRCVWYHNANCFDDVNIAPTVERVPQLKATGEYAWEWPVLGGAEAA